MTERTLARVVTIDELLPIEGADRIELAIVGGWQVVVQKGLYEPGVTKAIYFEVDSLLDTTRPYFNSLSTLSSKLLHEVDGKVFARIKTMKLRKQLSQGFCVPLSDTGVPVDTEVGADLTKALGVIKYEKTEEKNMNDTGSAGGAKSGFKKLGFPAFVPKTDQTRVQNIALYPRIAESGEIFEESFKLDGSSLSAFGRNGVLGVASRNVGFRVVAERVSFLEALKDWFFQKRPLMQKEWKRNIPADDNAFVKMAHEAGLLEAIKADGRNLAIQGEMVGPSIQKNFEGVDKNEFYCYDVYLIDEQRYMLPAERREFCAKYNVQHVPINSIGPLPATVKECLAKADGPSGIKGKYREGFVYKSESRDYSFKAISNTYLLKEE